MVGVRLLRGREGAAKRQVLKMDHNENMIYVSRREPTRKPLVVRLRELCDDCSSAPENCHSSAPVGLVPLCYQCQLDWQAADEIEYLRERIEELKHELTRG